MDFSPRRTGVAHLPLHGGKAPVWLFNRMRLLAREITIAVVSEYGSAAMLDRISDPCWFQAFGCVLGFDWHSSGVTTTVCGALKEGIRDVQKELGFYVAGGKGATARKTPGEIEGTAASLKIEPDALVTASRMSAKVDNTALQDGYSLYHHSFFYTSSGSWSVVQQGMNGENHYARRYHWRGDKVTDFVCEPHTAICSQTKARALNFVAGESAGTRETIARIASGERPEKLIAELEHIKTIGLPARHHITAEDIHPQRLKSIFLTTYESKPEDFRALLAIEGVGPKTLRALGLISELVYDQPVSVRDPARYSFAHGGKDGHPFPVDRETYDRSIEILHTALKKARLGDTERIAAFKRLRRWQ